MPNKEIIAPVVLWTPFAARLKCLPDLGVEFGGRRASVISEDPPRLPVDVVKGHLSSALHRPDQALGHRSKVTSLVRRPSAHLPHRRAARKSLAMRGSAAPSEEAEPRFTRAEMNLGCLTRLECWSLGHSRAPVKTEAGGFDAEASGWSPFLASTGLLHAVLGLRPCPGRCQEQQYRRRIEQHR